MPIRLLRDWTASEKIDRLSDRAEIFFVRLIMKADDYGCFHANDRLLLANLFPLKTAVKIADIQSCVAECIQAGLIVLYRGDNGKDYLQIKNFNQRLRTQTSKFPLPGSEKTEVKKKPRAIDRQVSDDRPHVADDSPQDADELLTIDSQSADNWRPDIEVEVEGKKITDIEEEKEDDLYLEVEGEPNLNKKNQSFFSYEKTDMIFDIGELKRRALSDDRWIDAVQASESQLSQFNSILERRFQTKLTEADYRFYFASMKDKYPERFKRQRSAEEIRADAIRLTEELKKENKKL